MLSNERSVARFPDASTCCCIVVICPFFSRVLLFAFLPCSSFDDSLDVGAVCLTSNHTQLAIMLLRRSAIQRADLISAKELWDKVSQTQRDCSFVQTPYRG